MNKKSETEEELAELSSYTRNQYRKPVKDKYAKGKPMAVATRKPLSEPATTAATKAPFKIVSGVKAAQPFLKLFIYGDYGAGKTVLAAQASDVESMRDVLFIDIEGGSHSIRGSRAVRNHANIDVVKCFTFEDFVATHKMLMAYCQARDDNDDERLKRMADRYEFPALAKRHYRSVIIDSLSELNQISLQRAFGENPDDLLSTSDSDDTRRDFGRNKQSMSKTIRAFRNLPMNVIATCGRDEPDSERKRYKFQPRLTGALAKEVQAFWDVVGFLQTAAKKPSDDDDAEGQDASPIMRRLWLQPVGKFDAKNRLSSQDVTHIDDPTMEKLVALLTRKAASK